MGRGGGRLDIWGRIKDGMLFLAVRRFRSIAKNKISEKFLKTKASPPAD